MSALQTLNLQYNEIGDDGVKTGFAISVPGPTNFSYSVVSGAAFDSLISPTNPLQRSTIATAVDGIMCIDERGRADLFNPACERIFGYSAEEVIGQNIRMLMPPKYADHHDQYIHSYVSTGVKKIIGIGREVEAQRKDGTTFPVHLSVGEFEADGRRYFTGMVHDISDRTHVEEALRESERRLAHAQKMEAVGQLTGGIAHDFNNLLLVITGNLELLEPRLNNDESRALLKEAQDAAGLGSKLTDQLLTFARRRHMDAHVIQLNDLVVSITDMLRRTLGEHITLSTSLAREAWPTRADPGQFQSAIVNMAVNARDAMPQGGKLVVETRNIKFDADHDDYQSELRTGQYVQLSISDTGAGMEPEIRDRVFEPFFTTKEKGRGTGLGLAMVYGFVKQSGGHVTIYSEPGLGTTINLYFPRSDVPSGQAPFAKGTATPAVEVRETVLVVEDDSRVRQLTIKRLKLIGYQVLEASDGPAALEILKRGDAVDLVFTDLIMPGGLSGREVAMRARELRPGVKVLLTSGYAEELVHGDDLQREQLKVLRKPYQQADLIAALRDVLGDGARHS
ncbi:MAG: PAS domain S-box protein [Rhodospirillales bacterium]|nr:PAS domain S-box protein [Rhodospirillales bacterium]